MAFDPVLNQVYCAVKQSNMVGFGNSNGWAYTVYTINSQTGANISETDIGDVATSAELAGYDGFILGYKSDTPGSSYNPYAATNNYNPLPRRNYLKKGNTSVRIYAERVSFIGQSTEAKIFVHVYRSIPSNFLSLLIHDCVITTEEGVKPIKSLLIKRVKELYPLILGADLDLDKLFKTKRITIEHQNRESVRYLKFSEEMIEDLKDLL